MREKKHSSPTCTKTHTAQKLTTDREPTCHRMTRLVRPFRTQEVVTISKYRLARWIKTTYITDKWARNN
jgi:hypothetical protein